MNANAYAAYGNWCGLIPDGHETCPGCGHKERISRIHLRDLELGCMKCHHTNIVPNDSLPEDWVRYEGT